MTALNIRKNLSNLLHITADAVANVKAPSVPSKAKVQYSIDNVRRNVAKRISPDNWSVQAGDQVQTLVQLLPHRSSKVGHQTFITSN